MSWAKLSRDIGILWGCGKVRDGRAATWFDLSLHAGRVSITFVGFAALFTALREVVAGKTTAFDVVLTRNHFVLGFMVVAASLLPPLLALFPLPEHVVWRAASFVAAFPPAVFAIRYPKRRFAATQTAMPVGTKIILFFFISPPLFCW